MTKTDWDREEYERWHRMGRERGWFDKARDEVASWFGDEEAERRRRFDERERARREGRYASESERTERPYSRSEWERPTPGSYTSPYTGIEYGSSRYTREREFGREPRYGTTGRELEHERMYGTGRESEFFNVTGSSLGSSMGSDVYGSRTGFGRQQQLRGGRAPRSYQRTDDRILDDLHEKLHRHPEIDARDIEIEVKNGDVILKGSVNDRRDKRLAEDIADDVYGVHNVQNMIRVIDGELSLEKQRQQTSPTTLKR